MSRFERFMRDGGFLLVAMMAGAVIWAGLILLGAALWPMLSN